MSYNTEVQKHLEEYKKTLNGKPFNKRAATLWLIQQGKLKIPLSKEIDILSKDVGRALRTEYIESPEGKRIRKNHCVKYKEKSEDGSEQQLVLWWAIELATTDFMQQSISQRRTGFRDGNWQMVKDVEYYNEHHNKLAPIEVSVDYREDIEELRMSQDLIPFDDEE